LVISFTLLAFATPQTTSSSKDNNKKKQVHAKRSMNKKFRSKKSGAISAAERLYRLAEKENKRHQFSDALAHIGQALSLKPVNEDYLKLRSGIADAMMAYPIEEDSYRRLVALKPKNADNWIGLANTLAYEYKFAESESIFRKLACTNPRKKDLWIEFAYLKDMENEYLGGLALFNEYRWRFRTARAYWKRLARVLADAGRYYTSIRINESLFWGETKDDWDYLMTTRALDLSAANCKCAAVNTLNVLRCNKPYSTELVEATKRIITPLRSNISFVPCYYYSNCPVSIVMLPLDIQYFINPRTSLLLRDLYEEAYTSSNPDNNLTTIWGVTSILDETLYVGFTRSGCFWNLESLVGALEIERTKITPVARVKAKFYPNETLHLEIEELYDLYRPYLFSESPRSISLGILETATIVNVYWEPVIETYLDCLFRRGDLTDGNNYWRVNLKPMRRAFTWNNINVDFGLNLDYMHFSRDLFSNGYFSPVYYGLYQVATGITFNRSENINIDFYLAVGTENDTENRGDRAEIDCSIEAKFGVYCDWQLSLLTEVSNQIGPNAYNDVCVRLELKRRF
jgi:tetratricopeptide (TPR) repeat protein